MQFHMNDEAGEFLSYVQGLLFEGTILAYDTSTNKAEWVPMHGSMEYLMGAEQSLVVDLINMVLCSGSPAWVKGSLTGPSSRLRKFADETSNTTAEMGVEPKRHTNAEVAKGLQRGM